jgi:hypothetical protein
MKKYIIYITIATALLASCTKETKQLTTDTGNVALGVTAKVAGIVNTRSGSITDQLNQSGDAIGLFITGGTGTTAYKPLVTQYSYDGTALWIAQNKIYLSNEIAAVYGYYPADAANSVTLKNDNTNLIPLKLTQTVNFDGSGQIDYMYATSRTGTAAPFSYPLATASNALNKSQVDLYFHHALSKLSFVVNKSASYVGAGHLSKIQLSCTSPTFNLYTKMSVADGTLSNGSQVNSLTLSGTEVSINDSPSTNIVAKGIFAPLASTAGITLTMTIDNKEMSVVLPSTIPSDSWIAGNDYTYTITVKGTELVVNTVTIVPWGEVAGGGAEVQ